MKTTMDIPEALLQETVRHTGAKTERAAVIAAMHEFNRLRRLKLLAARWHGACPDFMTQKELQTMRTARREPAAQ